MMGLVLEGGAMRGMFTAGVLDVMMESQTEVDGVIGVSAGATFGCNFVSRQIGRTIRYNKRFAKDPRYCSYRSLIRTGNLYNAQFCYYQVPMELDPFDHYTFKKNPTSFYCVATQVDGKPLYHLCKEGIGKDLLYIQGSASMPVFARSVKVDDKELLDGGISDSIPLEYFESIGYNKNIVVLTQPRDYHKEPYEHMNIMKMFLKKQPELISLLENRHIRYNRQVEYVQSQKEAGKAFIIQPEESLNIGPIEHDPKELERVYQTGRNVMQKHMDELKEFMKRDLL